MGARIANPATDPFRCLFYISDKIHPVKLKLTPLCDICTLYLSQNQKLFATDVDENGFKESRSWSSRGQGGGPVEREKGVAVEKPPCFIVYFFGFQKAWVRILGSYNSTLFLLLLFCRFTSVLIEKSLVIVDSLPTR